MMSLLDIAAVVSFGVGIPLILFVILLHDSEHHQ